MSELKQIDIKIQLFINLVSIFYVLKHAFRRFKRIKRKN